MEGQAVDFVGGSTPVAGTKGQTVMLGPGKLFQLGTWGPSANRPAGFSLNAAEADAAIAAGGRVPIEVEHVRSVFDGKLGFAALTGRSGADLMGTLTIPRALADLLGTDKPLKVSMVWDTVAKVPLRVGLVLNPAISGAEVAAAFSAAGIGIDTAGIYARLNGAPCGPTPPRGATDPAAIYARLNAPQAPSRASGLPSEPSPAGMAVDAYARLNGGA